MGDIIIKKIKLEEVEALHKICIDTFKETYESANDPIEFKNYLQSAFNLGKLKQELSNSNSHHFMIYRDYVSIGYYQINTGNAQTEKMSEDYAELERIYLYGKYHGLGIGAKMIQDSVNRVRQLGKKKLWLGVWDKNTKAIKFYKKMGFTIFDTHLFTIGNVEQTDFMMEKRI